ncbi:MAG: sigma-54-dependent transcriptional regulator [Planctomycetota bacterium]
MAREDIIILVVDDERNHANGVAEAIEKFDARVIAVYNGRDAVEILRNQHVAIVITDLKLDGDIDGLTILEEAKKANNQTEVILMTAYATIDTCKEAIRRGAYDYLTKPIDVDQMRNLVSRLMHKTTRAAASRGKGAHENAVFAVLKRVAPTDIAVLIEGESGTGKELLARGIHKNSKRRHKPFKPLNCAGLTETLLESELFGHAKGSFTGAASDRKGLFEIADGGTLFLDEIGDMPLNMQAKLLRVLEDGIVVPVGSNRQIMVDVRIISATNHDLTLLTEENKFRQDLYFRIKGVSVSLPALRDRVEDIPVFIKYFAEEASAEIGAEITGMSEAALAVLMSYDWPGNIRQLRNCLKTMVVMCEGDKLDVRDIPPDIHQVRQLAAASKQTGSLAGVSLNELEKQAIIDTLAKTKNNREKAAKILGIGERTEKAAKILGIGERTLYRKIKEYNL